MQVSKFVLSVCATTVCAGFLSLHAQDTPAQAAARAALMQSMGEPAAAPATPAVPVVPTNNPPIMVESSGVVTPQANAPVETNQVATPAATMQPLDSEAQTRAREALLQAMGQPAAAPTAPATQPPATAQAPAAPVAATQPLAAIATPSTAVAAPTTAATAPAAPVKTSNATMVGQEPGFSPIVAPPPPVSTAQEQQLDALLSIYKANQISPEEYQKQRADILAEPGGASH